MFWHPTGLTWKNADLLPLLLPKAPKPGCRGMQKTRKPPTFAGQRLSGCVDLVSAYSNRDDLVFELVTAMRQLEEARSAGGSESRLSVQSVGRVGRAHGLQDRLSQADLQNVVTEYEAGELRKDLAERYGISVSSVARILRAHRAAQAQDQRAS